ncbi:glycoside hydrolase family 13 protein [Roseofilum capinflatum]|uniref:Glycoside hydrolase family 13 protein n=1 Tax=Roseofilum capinflatum BLCC-M114 TaxID=3022440 RepID=A0ABT7B7U4_9CYAN|nr:glycoside hydrolase family 13 protein [Roseofilum capinflatum]MDJ1175225.1 glycoside hydrolase family 13 protein [Roseofilum capinflatum BLCC-M114]
MNIQTPEWVKHAVFYQIFPDRLAKGNPPPGTTRPHLPLEPWDSPPTVQGYKGGNLWGTIETLDYLQNLGITAIYFTPIFQSACNHRYHTHDYTQVDPMLGGNEAFFALLEAAHKRNIKIVLDGVFNHASRGFFYFHDILENGPHSPWVDWFKIEDWPLSAYDGSKPANYVGWANNRALPEFNHQNPDVREYIMQIAEYWIRLGVDGWRLDVPFCINVEGFWQEFRQRVKAINPEAYIVGEIWTDALQWLDGTQFDGVMNYLFTAPTIAFTAGDRVDLDQVRDSAYEPYPALDAAGYASKIQSLLHLYDWEIQQTQLNLLDSHDTARLVTIAQGDRPSVELATLLLMTFPGAPSIYYGDEIGLAGARDPDCRRSFPGLENGDRTILAYHRQLIALRHQYRALRVGTYKVIFAEGLVYIFTRQEPDQTLIIALNVGEEAITVRCFPRDLHQTPNTLVYGQAEIEWSDNGDLRLELPARQGCILAPGDNGGMGE